MIIYSVEITLQPAIEVEWVNWMRQVHIPDVLGAGCFLDCRMAKVLDTDGVEPTYVLQYRCESLSEYERYRDNFAPARQKEHTERYAGQFRASRRLLEEVALLS